MAGHLTTATAMYREMDPVGAGDGAGPFRALATEPEPSPPDLSNQNGRNPRRGHSPSSRPVTTHGRDRDDVFESSEPHVAEALVRDRQAACGDTEVSGPLALFRRTILYGRAPGALVPGAHDSACGRPASSRRDSWIPCGQSAAPGAGVRTRADSRCWRRQRGGRSGLSPATGPSLTESGQSGVLPFPLGDAVEGEQPASPKSSNASASASLFVAMPTIDAGGTLEAWTAWRSRGPCAR